MEKSGLNVFVLQAYDADLEIMIDEMIKVGMINGENGDWYPYTFIGYDGWLDPATIAGNDKLRKYLSGRLERVKVHFLSLLRLLMCILSLPQIIHRMHLLCKPLLRRRTI